LKHKEVVRQQPQHRDKCQGRIRPVLLATRVRRKNTYADKEGQR
jgi:hypothetical protein